jgi:maleylacetoacetate isomerase
VRIALALKRVDYDAVWIDLNTHEQLGEDYAQVAATKQVPCLDIDGLQLVQSVAIIEYLNETRPEPALLPISPVARARVRSLVEIINSTIQPLHNLAVRERLQTQFAATSAAADAWCRYWIERRFEALERVLAATSGDYAFGDSVTLADVFLYPQAQTSGRFGVELAAYPMIAALTRRLAQRDAFAQSHAPVP